MSSSAVIEPLSPRPSSGKSAAALPAVDCRGVAKRFYVYEHRTTTLQQLFIRLVLRRPIHVGEAEFQLTDFSLCVARGESVALLGRNGSGKSTALRLIAGVFPPSEGTIEVRGRLVSVISLGASFHSELTGAENVALYAAAIGMTRSELAERYDSIVELSGVGKFANVPVKYYSSGMGARLAFAVAAFAQPHIFVLDEVLAVSDGEFRERCIQRLNQFSAGGGTLVMVSHDPEILRRLCTRAVWLERGAIRMSGEIETVLTAYQNDL